MKTRKKDKRIKEQEYKRVDQRKCRKMENEKI